MRYIVMQEYTLPDDCGWGLDVEPGTVIEPGDTIVDGDLEPDLVAALWAGGIIEPENMEAEAARLADAEEEPE